MNEKNLNFVGYIELPAHQGQGGFDHAAVHLKTRQLYVAHTANDALDVIDLKKGVYSHSISGLKGTAGALVSNERDLIFTSNRGEDTVGIFLQGEEESIRKIPVGSRPNGLAFDPEKNLLLSANVGIPNQPESFSLSLIDVTKGEVIRHIPVPGRTRWAIFDARSDSFYVNIGTPAQIIILPSSQTAALFRSLDIPGEGPHGLDLDCETGRLFCACDGQQLITLDVKTGQVLCRSELSGPPDVIFFNPTLKHLYVAIGDPGVIDVFETDTMTKLATTPTERGAHTIAFDPIQNQVYAFLPESHRVAVFFDRGLAND